MIEDVIVKVLDLMDAGLHVKEISYDIIYVDIDGWCIRWGLGFTVDVTRESAERCIGAQPNVALHVDGPCGSFELRWSDPSGGTRVFVKGHRPNNAAEAVRRMRDLAYGLMVAGFQLSDQRQRVAGP